MKPAGLLQVTAVLPAAFFVLGYFGRLYWLLDLFSHFRVQYAAALLASALGFFLLRCRKSAIASLLGGLVIAATFLSFPGKSPAAGASRLGLISYNVNTSNTRHADVLRFLESEDADVIFLMEVNDDWMTALRPLESRYPHRLAAPREDNFGIALYSKLPFQGGAGAFGDYEIPWADITLAKSGIRLVAIHPLPPSGEENSDLRNRQLLETGSAVKGHPRTVLCGDFNLTPYSPWFRELLTQSGLHNPAPPYSPTWMRHHPLFAIPIDHVLLSPDLALSRRKIGPAMGSDHNPVVVEIANVP